MEEIQAITAVLNNIGDLGVAAVCLLLSYFFITGRIVPRSVVDDLIDKFMERSELNTRIIAQEVSEAVESGMIKAMSRQNKDEL